MTIEDLLMREEGQTFDRKSVKIEPRSLAIVVSAMANADGGDVVIGITDRKCIIEGVDNDVRVNELLKVPFDFCVPSVAAKAELVECIDSKGNPNHVLVFHIEASEKVHANQIDEVYLRVGDSSRKLNFEERVSLMSDKGQMSYESTWFRGSTLNDINMDLVEDYCKVIHYEKSPEEYLRENDGYLVLRDGKYCPTAVTLLLFGKKPQSYLPRAWVRFVRYDGIDEQVGAQMNVIKDVTFIGTLREQIDKSVAYLATQIKEHTYLAPDAKFRTDLEYPEFVRQELIVNAICHRDYSITGTDIQVKLFDNRLVVESPGNLPGLVRTDNIRHTHFSRNRLIAQYLKAYGYVKEFGEGVDRMCRELEETGCSPIKYTRHGFILHATAYSRFAEQVNIQGSGQTTKEIFVKLGRKSGGGLGRKLGRKLGRRLEKGTREKILSAIRAVPSLSQAKLADIVEITPKGVQWHITKMQKEGIIRHEGPAKGGYWVILRNEK